MPTTEERQRTITVVSVIVTAIAITAFVAFDPGTLGTRIREAIGAEGRIHPEVQEQGIPGGHYEFLATQRGSDDPVRWNPCREIHYAVNPEGSPPDWKTLVEDGVDEVEARTGLAFRFDGTTDDRGFEDRFAANGDPLPVLIGWADDEEVPDLEGDVAGIGGATYAELGGRRAYVTGMVVLDVETYDRLAARRTPTPSSSRCCCTSSATWSGSPTSTTAARSCTPTASPAPPTAPATRRPGPPRLRRPDS